MSRKILFVFAAIALLALAACAGPEGPQGPAGAQGPAGPQGPAGESAAAVGVGAEHVGAATCGACHDKIYETFMKSGHPYKLNPVVDGKAPTFPFTQVPEPPPGYTWDDISYVIGGYGWKARFVNQQGYIITDEPGKSGNEDYTGQWNFANAVHNKAAGWVKWNAGKPDVPYNCGSCHTTGYNPRGTQEDMPGMVGTWAEPGVQCEACHGPGSLHIQNPQGVSMTIDRSPEACGACHTRGDFRVIDSVNGFMEHREQTLSLFQSKHYPMGCVTCHDPHAGVIQLRQAGEQVTDTKCESCHFMEAEVQKPHVGNLDCVTCHMPRIARTAVGNAAIYTGDMRAHLFGINPYQFEQFTEDGKASLPYVGLNFACKQCHVEGGSASVKDDQVLIDFAAGFHNRDE